jgi:hypothetical protein
MMGPLYGQMAGITMARGGAESWWPVTGKTCVAAYQPKGAASLASSYINLANPGTYDAAPGTAPTLGANGWVFNGSTQHLDTSVIPGANYSAILRYSAATQSGDRYLAAAVGTGLFGFESDWNIPRYYFYNGSVLTIFATILPAAGILAVTDRGYLDAVDKGSLTKTGSTVSMYIGAGHYASAPLARYHGALTVTAFAIYSAILTGGEVGALTTAMAAL